ncbi:MAG: S-layer homology domain-containing protein [Bacillota bacterium]
MRLGGRIVPRVLASMLAATMLSAALPAPAEAAQLTDIARHWARTQIQAGVADGYIHGFPDSTFRPDQPITRAEFFKLLAGALKLKPQPSLQAPFAEASHWAMQQGQIQAAVSGGLLLPTDYGTSFQPDGKIPRREIVLAAVRAVGKEPLVGKTGLTTPDAAGYPEWLQNWAAVAVADGLLTGYEDGSLGLERTATRAEALVIVQRILERVTMNLAPSETQGAPNLVRHPAEGEPTWTVTAEGERRPSFSDGTHAYTVPTDVRGFNLMPSPGQAAWLLLVEEVDSKDSYRVGRLHKGALAEVGRYADGVALLAVDAGGRLWFSKGNDLLIADAAGKVTTIPVGERLLLAEIDWQGNLWAVGLGPLHKVSPDGIVEKIPTGLSGQQQVRHLSTGEDGSVWLMLAGAGQEARVEAVRIRDGKVAQRVPLLSRYFGGEGRPIQAAVLGRSGPYRFIITLSEGATEAERQESLFRFDLETGVNTRLVPPRSAGKAPVVMPAPDGGALLRDTTGKFWRIVP